ncbi:MAG: acyl-[acyl-carrier-protein] thioesterase [Lachnospiraceae bacterium]|nr:acyl-[acyl-carrier-protein] thioesterase [Lachnospiraceae bacterium]
MYTFTSKIRFSEVGQDGLLTMPSLVNYYQDCTIFQSEGSAGSLERLKEKGYAWLLSSWQIVVARYPRLCEEVVTGTIPYKIKQFFGERNFFMDSPDGERLSWGNSLWILMDMEKNSPGRMTPEIEASYPIEERLDMDYAPRKIRFPKDGDTQMSEEITVRLRDLDTNRHMNNEQYIRIAVDCLPPEAGWIREMRAEYRKQAFLGDIIRPLVNLKETEGLSIYTVALNGEDGTPFCTVEFKVAKK